MEIIRGVLEEQAYGLPVFRLKRAAYAHGAISLSNKANGEASRNNNISASSSESQVQTHADVTRIRKRIASGRRHHHYAKSIHNTFAISDKICSYYI